MTANASRPKIHRLPVPPRRRGLRHPLILVSVAGLGIAALAGVKTFSILGRKTDMMEAQTASLAPLADANAADRKTHTVLLQGQEGVIIGQMAKIPADNEQITEIRPVSPVDNHAARELLSIISKY